MLPVATARNDVSAVEAAAKSRCFFIRIGIGLARCHAQPPRLLRFGDVMPARAAHRQVSKVDHTQTLEQCRAWCTDRYGRAMREATNRGLALVRTDCRGDTALRVLQANAAIFQSTI